MLWQQILVGFIVGAALLFAAWRLPGTATRLRYVRWMNRLSRGRGPLARVALKLEARLRQKQTSCAGCSSGASSISAKAVAKPTDQHRDGSR